MEKQWTVSDENIARRDRNDFRRSIHTQVHTLNRLLSNATLFGIREADELMISDGTLTEYIGQDEAEVVAGLELA